MYSSAVETQQFNFLEHCMCSLPHHLHLQVCPSKPLAINSKVANPIAWPLREQVTFHKQRNPFPWCFYSTTARLVKTWRIQTISQLCPIQNAKHLVPLALCFWLTWLKQQGWLCCANKPRSGKRRESRILTLLSTFLKSQLQRFWGCSVSYLNRLPSIVFRSRLSEMSWKNSGNCKTILMTIVISISVPQLPSKRPSQV